MLNYNPLLKKIDTSMRHVDPVDTAIRRLEAEVTHLEQKLHTIEKARSAANISEAQPTEDKGCPKPGNPKAFDSLIEEIRSREKVSRVEAMSLARRRHPEAYGNYQAGPLY